MLGPSAYVSHVGQELKDRGEATTPEAIVALVLARYDFTAWSTKHLEHETLALARQWVANGEHRQGRPFGAKDRSQRRTDGYYKNRNALRPSKRPNYPQAHGAVYRIVAEAILGRPLRRGEEVHHLDNNPLNSHPANLVLLSHLEPLRLHNHQMSAEELERHHLIA